MKMSFKLAPLAAFFCYLLLNVRSISDFLLEMRTQHADDDTVEANFLVLKRRRGVGVAMVARHLLLLHASTISSG